LGGAKCPKIEFLLPAAFLTSCQEMEAMMRRSVICLLVLGLSLTVQVPNASAISFNELGDAGDLPALSQAAGVLPLLTTITGSIGSSTDADMFAITISHAGTFSATTVGTPGTLVDTQLFLFRFPGFGVVANDDSKLTLRSTIPSTPVTPGLYFLAISSYDLDPVSPGGLIFPTFPFDQAFGPTGPGGGSAITGWQSFGGTGTYTIALDLTPVPEPGTLLLFGTALAGVAWVRQRMRP
jgi:hypothetical protein